MAANLPLLDSDQVQTQCLLDNRQPLRELHISRGVFCEVTSQVREMKVLWPVASASAINSIWGWLKKSICMPDMHNAPQRPHIRGAFLSISATRRMRPLGTLLVGAVRC